MGRTCKRVPLDFEWGMHKIWVGYINPYRGVDCPFCKDGYSKEAQKIRDSIYRMDHDDEWIRNPYRTGQYNPKQKVHNMTQDEVDHIMSTYGNDRRKKIMDDIVKPQFPDAEAITPDIFSYIALVNPLFPANLEWELIKYHSKKEGWDSSCPHCNGEGTVYINDEIKRMHDEFDGVEPPAGEGYQMWETTTEGSPVSPVFKTPEELAEYCERAGVSWFGHRTASKDDWLRVINDSIPASIQIAPGVIAM